MLTKNEIISDLFKSKDFNSCIAKMKPTHLQDDLKSEVILILCESSDDKIQGLHASGGLKFYTVRIILNLIQSNTSPFYKKFRSGHEELQQIETASNQEYAGQVFSLSERADKEKSEDLALLEIENLYWYDKEIVKLYVKLGNYRAIEAETGIPFESVYKTVIRSCKQIRNKIV